MPSRVEAAHAPLLFLYVATSGGPSVWAALHEVELHWLLSNYEEAIATEIERGGYAITLYELSGRR